MWRSVVAGLGLAALFAGSMLLAAMPVVTTACCAVALAAGLSLGPLRHLPDAAGLQFSRVLLLSGSMTVMAGAICTTAGAVHVIERFVAPVFEEMFFEFGTFAFFYAIGCFLYLGFVISSGSTSRE